MPISREQVRKLCSEDEYDVYTASLRLQLPKLRASELEAYVVKARGLATMNSPSPHVPLRRDVPRKAKLLSGALSRLRNRLQSLKRAL